MEEVVVTATRTEMLREEVPAVVDVITPFEIKTTIDDNLARILKKNSSVESFANTTHFLNVGEELSDGTGTRDIFNVSPYEHSSLLLENMNRARGNGILSAEILKGLTVSILAHMAVFLAVSAAPWLMPPGEALPHVCTVSLVTMQDLGDGGGSGEGEEGTMGRGNGEPKPGEGSEAVPSTPEPENTGVVQLSKVEAENVPQAPVQPKVEKAVEKPRPKPKPELKPVPRQLQTKRGSAGAETPPPAASRANAENTGAPGGGPCGKGEGAGRGDADGTGRGNSGDGPGAGSGIDAGGGQGLFNAAFGSGDGPRFVARVLPRYPRLARELGKEGTVLLMVTIDEHGRLIAVEVVKRAGSGFDEEAIRAIKSSTFSPAKRNGKPVLCKANIPILFRFTDKESN